VSVNEDKFRITHVYTRGGDGGRTGLVNGDRIAKHHPRLEAYGTVDELSSLLGVVRADAVAPATRFDRPTDGPHLDRLIAYLQNLLFTLGGDLATPLADRHPNMPVVVVAHVQWLEATCDHYNATLRPLKDFVLPAGGAVGAGLHVARCVCRRAERAVSLLAEAEPGGVDPICLVFLNRLSDALFVLARWATAAQGLDEAVWDRALQPPPFA
jgi:cob(I)alamin adenosyltransferase